MSNETTTFKVTLEFEVTVNPIDIPDTPAVESKPDANKPLDEKALRAALKAKGLSADDIEQYVEKARNDKTGTSKGGKSKGAQKDYQMLLYPHFQDWAAAQRSLQNLILDDDDLSRTYIREMVRDLTSGQVESLVTSQYGAPGVDSVLKQAIRKLSDEDRQVLRTDEASLLHDETELLDASVDCRFAGLTVNRL